MSRCIGTSALNHVWRMKCWTEPNPQTHEKTSRMEPSSPRSVCVFAAWRRGERLCGWAEPGRRCASPAVLCTCSGGCINPRCGLTFRVCGWFRRGESVKDSSKMWTPNMGQEVTAIWVAWGQGSSQKKQSLVNQRNCPECREHGW